MLLDMWRGDFVQISSVAGRFTCAVVARNNQQQWTLRFFKTGLQSLDEGIEEAQGRPFRRFFSLAARVSKADCIDFAEANDRACSASRS